MQQFITHNGYLAILVLMIAESALIPIPSEVTMMLGGALAAGAVPGVSLDPVLVIVAGVVGNLIGSYLAWALGRYGGRAAWRKFGRFLFLREHDIDTAQRWFDRHGQAAVFFGRLLPAVRTVISLPAGFAGMKPIRFGLFTLAGCIPWTSALVLAGFAVGARWHSIAAAFSGPTYAIAGVVAVVVVVALVVVIRRRRRNRPGPPDPTDLGDPADPREDRNGQRSRS